MPLLSTRGAASAKGFGLTAGGVVFVEATGGTVTTSGDYKIHTFTGPGSFVVSKAPAAPTGTVDYLVVAGGGGGGQGGGSGGAGGGGYRESYGNTGPYTASPLSTPTGILVTATTYPITVGAGGTQTGGNGNPSTFSTITSAGGGAAGYRGVGGSNGGSGGGGGDYGQPLGNGNTPPVSPSQGNPGGNGGPPGSPIDKEAGGGGGGAQSPGGPGAPGPIAQAGFGTTTNISGGPQPYSWGSFGEDSPGPVTPRPTPAANTAFGGPATVNGDSGIVIIRYKYK
jgi:hypothetical protein